MRLSLLSKFFLVYMVIILCSFLILTFFSYKEIETFLIKDKEDILLKEATMMANENVRDLEVQIYYIDKFFNARIWLVDTEGNILADSRRTNNFVIPQLPLQEMDLDLLNNNFCTIGDFYGFFDEEMISVGVPFKYFGNPQGAILIHSEIKDIKERASTIFKIGLYSFGVVLLIAFVFIYLFTRKILVSLRAMNKAAKKYANGDFEIKVPVKSKDEIGMLSESFNNMGNELSNLETFRRQFIANISHDFRSPLTSIKGYVGAILDGTISKEDQDKYLHIVLNETDRLSKLTSDILFLTKMETQGLQLNYITFDLHHVIRKVVALFEQQCLIKNINVILLLQEKALLVSADFDRIQQVLYNLFDNAVKFSKTGGDITIETTLKHDKAFVSIKDTGEGIPKNELNHIWERFYKSDTSRGMKKGTGLGLSIVKEIIKAHNEQIEVTSEIDKGTEFIFTLRTTK